jgi:hypothetical protein
LSAGGVGHLAIRFAIDEVGGYIVARIYKLEGFSSPITIRALS